MATKAREQNAMKPLVCAIGVSRKDATIAATWVRWVRLLHSISKERFELMLCYTRDTLVIDFHALCEAAGHLPSRFVPLPDLKETGYPGSASHLFLRTMETCERDFPGHPVLWVEADAIPTRPGWFQEIEVEYQTCGKPFMGHLELNIRPPHMAGVAVYPPNWRQLSPRLARCHQAPDTRQWGRGKGQAFDVYAAPDIMPQAAQARTIQQVWNCPHITETNIAQLISPEAALFHQCKSGALIDVLSRKLAQQHAA